jgi:hypothetical protein
MARGTGGGRRPATKFAHLQKKIGKQNVQRNLQMQPPKELLAKEPDRRPRGTKGLP